ncbi:MAG TPA: SDR family NAD(P)-dependent oxidoreductase [Myxococcota bacterium]|nr:SDR family NAD(P)-dependent oxidoreductase [Myxococcota bacterium]
MSGGSRLEGRRALVTGGSRGIGRAIAVAFAAEGADVAIGYRREHESAQQTVEAVCARGRKGFAKAADVRDAGAVRALVEESRDALGGLDIVVANAGVPTRFEPLEQVDPSYWQRVIDIDLHGVFHTLHAALPVLQAQSHGVVLTISSVAADLCAPFGGPYVAAKAAVNALTRVIARENAAKGIRCNVIAPGLIATDIADGMVAYHGDAIVKSIPLRRMGSTDEVAQLAVYLASDDAVWITGKIFRIDGGQYI